MHLQDWVHFTSADAESCCQVNATGAEDASNVTLSGGGLTARSKPASFIRVQDAEPMYTFTAYSDGQMRRSK